MKSLTIPSDEFDLKGFAQAVISGEQCIMQIDADDPSPLSGDEVSEAISLVRSGHPVFFGFHHSYIGEPVVCADGILDVPDENDEDLKPAALALLRRTRLADDGNYGFSVSEENGQTTIQPVFEVSGPTAFDPESDCGLFDERMTAFCRRFIC